MTILKIAVIVLAFDVVFLAAILALSSWAERRRPKRKPTRSSDIIITELRAALDSGRLDASVARIIRRNETRRMQ